MARATSYNYEIRIGDDITNTIYPASISEFGEGEEGRIKVADGDRKYNIRDQIYDIGEIEVVIYMKDDLREYNIMQAWCADTVNPVRDVWIIGRGAGKDVESGGSGRVETTKWLCVNCECAMGKKSGFDRNGKTYDSKRYYIIPEIVEDWTGR